MNLLADDSSGRAKVCHRVPAAIRNPTGWWIHQGSVTLSSSAPAGPLFERRALFPKRAHTLLCARELLQREQIADVRERLVTGEAFRLVDGLVLLVRLENRVVPILIA
jgi:hypothetical protein